MTIKRNRPQIRHRLMLLLILGSVCFWVWAIIQNLTMSQWRKALPSTAQDVREWQWDEGGPLPQDYIYLLRARITDEEFEIYVKQLGLVPYLAGREYSHGFTPRWYFSQLTDEQLKWWTPTDSSDGTYINDGGSWWRYAKYKNGYVYVVSYNI